MRSEGWTETTIGEQATLQRGIDITKAEQRPGHVPVISSGGISSYHDESQVEGPGVILGRKGVVGSVWFIEEDYWPHDTTLWVKDFHGNDPRFVYYFFKSFTREIASLDVGSANPTLNRNHLHPMKVMWPPLSEQRAIAGVLGSLDDKIALNRRMNRTLEAMARALFKSWFVDFDPVHANAAGQPSLPPDLAALFPAAFESSTLGEIPEGWVVKPLGELCDINARTLRKKDKLDQLEYVEISAANRGDIESIPHYDRDDAPGRARRRLRHGDVAVSTVRPDRGAYFLALNPPEHRIASTGFAVMSPRVPFSFLFVLMTRPEMSEKLGQLADGAAYPAVKPEQIAAIEVVIPEDVATLDVFHSAVEPLLGRMEQNRQESRTLAALRNALLPRLLSGELAVTRCLVAS